MEKDKTRIWKTLLRTVLAAALAAGLFRAAYTPFAIRNLWLPLILAKAGLEGSAEQAEYHPFRSGVNLTLRNLELRDGQGTVFRLESGECRLSFFRLFSGQLHADMILLRNSRLQLDPATFAGKKSSGSWNADDIQLGSLEIVDCTVSFRLENMPDLTGLDLKFLRLSGLHTEEDEKLNAKLQFRFAEGGRIPAEMETHLKIDRFFRPLNMTGGIRVAPGYGKFVRRSLDKLEGSVFFELQRTQEKDIYEWSLQSGMKHLDCAKNWDIRAEGHLSAEDGSGSAEIRTDISFQHKELHNLYFSFLDAERFTPENLNIKDCVIHLAWNDRQAEWETAGALDWSGIHVQGRKVLEQGVLHLEQAGVFRFSDKALTLHEFKLGLKSGKAELDCEGKGSYRVAYDPEDDGFHLLSGKSPVVLKMRHFPVAAVNHLLPFDFTGGHLDLDYELALDTVNRNLSGKMNLLLNGLAYSVEGRTLLNPHDVHVQMTLHSKGLENIEELTVDSCKLKISAGEETLVSGALQGKYAFRSSSLSLDGSLDVIPYAFLGQVRDPLAETIRSKLKEHNSETMVNHYQIRAEFDPGLKRKFVYSAETSLDTLSILDPEFEKNPLHLTLEGNAEQGIFRVSRFRLYAPELLDAAGSAAIQTSGGLTSFRWDIRQFAPAILPGVARLTVPEAFTEKELDGFHYAALTGSGSAELNPADHSIRLRECRFSMIPEKGAEMILKLEKEHLFAYDADRFGESIWSLTGKDVPMTWFNIYLPEDSPFRFTGGIANGTLDINIKEFLQHVWLKQDIFCENYSFSVNDLQWHAGDVRCTGKTGLTDYFALISFHDTLLRCTFDTEQYLTLTANGGVGLRSPVPTDLKAVFQSESARFPDMSSAGFTDFLPTEKFSGSGEVGYYAKDKFNDSKFSASAEIRHWSFRNIPAEKALHGKVSFGLQFKPDYCGLKDTGIELKNMQNQDILQLSLQSRKYYNDKKHTVCRVTSEGADAVFLTSLIRDFCRKKKKEKKQEAKTEQELREENIFWKIRKEPRIPEKFLSASPADVTLDFWNLRCGSLPAMTLNGKFSLESGTILADKLTLACGDTGAELQGKVNLKPSDGIEYNADLKVRSLDLKKIFRTIAELKNDPELFAGFAGTLQMLHAELQGKGISLDNLDQHLNFLLSASVEHLSIPLTVAKKSTTLQILLFPMEYIPELIKIFPEPHIRSMLQNLMGENIEIMTGKKNVEFDSGAVEIVSHATDLHIKRMYVLGPRMRSRVMKGRINPFYNELEVDVFSRFSNVDYPLRYTGTIDDPKLNKQWFAAQFIKENTLPSIREISFGLAGESEEEAWTKPAEIEVREEKSGNQVK